MFDLCFSDVTSQQGISAQDRAAKFHFVVPFLTLNGDPGWDHCADFFRKRLNTRMVAIYFGCRTVSTSVKPVSGHLRLLVKDYDAAMRTERGRREARQRQAQKNGQNQPSMRLADIYQRFLAYAEPDRQERGYALEEILYDTFLLFELNPQSAFRRKENKLTARSTTTKPLPA